MAQQRRRFSAQEKVAILRRHLVEKVPVSDLCDEFHLAPNLFYRWQKEFFENGAAAFVHDNGSEVRRLQEHNEALKTKLAHKDEVIAEIMESHVALKKGSTRSIVGRVDMKARALLLFGSCRVHLTRPKAKGSTCAHRISRASLGFQGIGPWPSISSMRLAIRQRMTRR
jgi:transposase-like protein